MLCNFFLLTFTTNDVLFLKTREKAAVYFWRRVICIQMIFALPIAYIFLVSIISGFMDRVQCFACGVALYNWSAPADPARQHAKASPSCHFLWETCGQEFVQAAQAEELIADVEHEEVPGIYLPFWLLFFIEVSPTGLLNK